MSALGHGALQLLVDAGAKLRHLARRSGVMAPIEGHWDLDGDQLVARPGACRISGWAAQVHGNGGVEVQVRLDGRLVASGVPELERPDVMQTLGSRYYRSGWSLDFEITAVDSGKEVQVVAVCPKASRSLGRRTVRVIENDRAFTRKTAGLLEQPASGRVLTSEVVHVAGWVVIDGRAADSVEVLVENQPPIRLRRCEPRPDLIGLQDPGIGIDVGAGFSELVPLRGKHSSNKITISVRAHGADGKVWHSTPRVVRIAHESLPRRRWLRPLQPRTATTQMPDQPARTARTVVCRDTQAVRTGKSSRPRIAVFTHSLDLGGAELYLQELLSRLSASNTADFLVISPRDGALRTELEAVGIEVHVTSATSQTSAGQDDPVATLRELLTTRQCDVALVNTLGEYVGVEAAVSCGVPVVWVVHESFDIDVYAYTLRGERAAAEVAERIRSALSCADASVFVAEATRALFQRMVPDMRSLCIRYGISLDEVSLYEAQHDRAGLRRELGFSEDDRIFLCMGIVQERKCQFALVHAFADVLRDNPNAKLVMVGYKPNHYGLAVKQCIEDLEVGHAVKLVDVASDTFRWFRISDILVSASDIESLPRSILEAMAFGLPILAADVFGVPEVVTDGVTGWLFEARDGVELRAGLERALACTDSALEVLSKNCRERALAFDGQGYATEFSRLLHELAAGPPNSDPQPTSGS